MDSSPRSEKALQLFMEGYNCAQSIVGAFADVLDLTEAQALELSSGFGAGMGDHKGICGAVSGMVLVAGALAGPCPPNDLAAKKRVYGLTKALRGAFGERFGDTNCGELLKKAACLPKPDPSERNAAYYARRPCAHFVEAAARLLEEQINQEKS